MFGACVMCLCLAPVFDACVCCLCLADVFGACVRCLSLADVHTLCHIEVIPNGFNKSVYICALYFKNTKPTLIKKVMTAG